MFKKKAEEGDSGAWMASYADMVTLLMVFFVLIVSMSVPKDELVDQLIAVLSGHGIPSIEEPPEDTIVAPGPIAGGLNMDTLFEAITSYIQDQDMREAISVSKEEDIVFIRFSSTMFFEPDRAVLLSASRPAVRFIGSVLKMYEDKIRLINICGHTARTGRVGGGVISDWSLSGERAATIAIEFENVSEINRSQMLIMGYGDNYPIADNATEEGRRQNRRVELVVVGIESVHNFDVYGVLSGTFEEVDGGDVLTPLAP